MACIVYCCESMFHPIFWLWNLGRHLETVKLPLDECILSQFDEKCQRMLCHPQMKHAAKEQIAFSSLTLVAPNELPSTTWDSILGNMRLMYPNLLSIKCVCNTKANRMTQILHIPSSLHWISNFGGLKEIKLDLRMKVSVSISLLM